MKPLQDSLHISVSSGQPKRIVGFLKILGEGKQRGAVRAVATAIVVHPIWTVWSHEGWLFRRLCRRLLLSLTVVGNKVR